jgi:hypothetical protein
MHSEEQQSESPELFHIRTVQPTNSEYCYIVQVELGIFISFCLAEYGITANQSQNIMPRAIMSSADENQSDAQFSECFVPWFVMFSMHISFKLMFSNSCRP